MGHSSVQYIQNLVGDDVSDTVKESSSVVSNDSGSKTTQKLSPFIPYPRTSSFSWNCFNQIAFVTNQKYNLDAIKQKPQLKR